MKITKISYSKTVESQVMGAGIWTKIGLEGDVGENESIVSAIEEAKATIEDALLREGVLLKPPTPTDLYFNVSTGKKES